jgi:hypothetical protein
MRIILEHAELAQLLKEALKARGVMLEEHASVDLRCNHKKGTVRLVIDTNPAEEPPAQ